MAHKIYGIPQTINSANYVYFLALRKLHRLSDNRQVRKDMEEIVIGVQSIPISCIKAELPQIDELLNLHRGQGLELLWRDSLTCPTESEYVDMVNNSMSQVDPDAIFFSYLHSRDRRFV